MVLLERRWAMEGVNPACRVVLMGLGPGHLKGGKWEMGGMMALVRY